MAIVDAGAASAAAMAPGAGAAAAASAAATRLSNASSSSSGPASLPPHHPLRSARQSKQPPATANHAYDDVGLPPASRLSHVCLDKLYVLCSRGQEPPLPGADGWEQPSVRAQLEVSCLDVGRNISASALSLLLTAERATPMAPSLACDTVYRQAAFDAAYRLLAPYWRTEALNHNTGPFFPFQVAQLALPVFVSRCEDVLVSFTRAERLARTGSATAITPASRDGQVLGTPSATVAGSAGVAAASAAGGGPVSAPQVLHDKAAHVLELLLQLRVLPVVADSLLPQRPQLRFWMEVGRALASPGAVQMPPLGAIHHGVAQPPLPPHSPTLAHTAPGSVTAAPPSLASAPSGSALSAAHSRRSSSGQDGLPGAAASFGDAAGAGHKTTGSASSSSASFFARTYSSTGALLSSAIGVATGMGGGAAAAQRGAAAAGGGPSPRPSNYGEGDLDGQGGRVAAGTAGMPSSAALRCKEQTHLVALYGVLCECISCNDPAVRRTVQALLMAVGSGLGMCGPGTQGAAEIGSMGSQGGLGS